MNGSDRLRPLSGLAAEAGSRGLAIEAESLAERLAEGRFYVACVGQFKRGKSSVLNGLVGEPVLPTGVIPVTAAVTVIRHGERIAARVRFGERDWEDCDPYGLATYVSEDQNPGNEKGVTGVEVFVPSPLLESGMGLVDTPGIGSISEANSAATRAFVPHIDAALVVLGADPPISGDELALIQDVARDIADLIFIFNKADRTSDRERAEAIRFTERVLAERLGRGIGPVLQVSATERLGGIGSPRDWDALVVKLASLARYSGADLVRAAETRGLKSLAKRLLRELDEQEGALLRPLEETQARTDALRRIVRDAERALDDVGHRLGAAGERLSRTFDEERDAFFKRALSNAQRELVERIQEAHETGPALRRRAIDEASDIAKRCLDRWRQAQEPRAETLYQEGVKRFVEMLNEFQASLAAVSVDDLPGLDAGTTLRARSRFHFTEMLTIAPAAAGSGFMDLLRPPSLRMRAIARDAVAYLERLLEVNSARIKNDFRDRVAESRGSQEKEIRDRLRELSASAERALEKARQAQAAAPRR